MTPIRLTRRALLAAMLAAGASNARGGAKSDDDRPLVAVSLPLLADIVRNVAGETVEVYSVMPEDADPHTWEATPRDFARVTASDLFVSMGASLEAFIEAGGWRRAVRDNGVPELILADHIELIAVDKVIDHGDHVHDLREGDPHVWLDPRKVIEMIPIIEARLAELVPHRAVELAGNAAAYLEQLAALDAELERDLTAIPVQRRKLIVFHDAYTYFSARFDFEVVGVVLANPDAEPSAREIVSLLDAIERFDVRVIFAEPQFNTDVLSVFVAEHGVAIGELLTDAFAGRVSSYIELMHFNRDSLRLHLT